MKLYAVMSVLGFGAFCYIIVEIRQLRKVRLFFEIFISFTLTSNFLFLQERRQKELEKKLDEPATQPPRKIDDETDDEKDELEEDIVTVL